jgi:hypothetical protein
MSALTRILNNQIYSKTIIASQKIADGTITGPLFASNVTVPGDFLITGNLFVLGSSQTTTIASTNTYVNDPLVVLNNGFAGTNTYDEGLIFNRGTADNKAVIWSETFKEFRLITTAEAGTTYGNITSQLGLANLSVGKFNAAGVATVGSFTTLGAANVGLLNATGNVSASQLIAETLVARNNYGNINFTQFNSIFADANASQNIVAIQLSTTGLSDGMGMLGTTGLDSSLYSSRGISFRTGVTVRNTDVPTGGVIRVAITAAGDLWANATTPASNTTTGAFVVKGGVGIGGNLYVGAGLQATTIGNVTPAEAYFTNVAVSGNIITGLLQAAAINSTPIGNATASTGTFTVLAATNNLWANASIATTTQGTGAVVIPNGGISVSGAANIALTATVGGATQLNSTLGVGGITTFTNPTNATSITDGAVKIQGGASVLKDLYVGGNLYAANIVGITANVITVEDPLLFLKPSYTFPYNYDIGVYSSFTGTGLTTAGNVLQHTAIVRHQETNTWTFASNLAEPGAGHVVFGADTVYDPIKAGNLQLTVTTDSTNATSGALIVAGGAGIGGNIFQTGTRLETSATNFLILNTPTTVDAFEGATTLNVGANSGTLTIGNPTLVGTQTTQALYNTVTTTLNFARAANITMGHTSGITTLQGAANIQAVTTSTNAGTGALKVQGGVGVVGNLNLAGDNTGIAYSGRGELTIGLDVAGGTLYPDNLVQFTSNANSFSRVSMQNISTQQLATSEFVALTNNGSNISGYIATGITSINFNSTEESPAIKPQDGYTYTSTGNLVLASGKDVVIVPGGLSNIGVRLSSTNGNVGIQYTTAATGITSGALTSVGGISTQANLYVAKGAFFNVSNGIEPFVINSSKVGNVAFAANVQGIGGTNTESVIIGGGNLTIQPGCILKVGGATSMMVPVGPTAARPSSQGGNDVQGMVRFNSTTNSLEFYDGTIWNVAGSVFTVISDRQFSGNTAGGFGNVDGTNTQFTLQATATTSSVIVSINGVMQFPTLAYSVSGTTMTFTEPPAPDDVIDVRLLTTTSTVSSITNGNGINQFIAADAGTEQWSGTSDGGTIIRTRVDLAGDFNLLNGTDIVYTQTAVNIVANNTPYVIATRSQTTFTSAKFIVSSKRGTGATGNVETYEAQVVTDGDGNAYISTYGITNNGYAMGVLTANVIAGNVNVYYTGTVAASVVQANVKAFGTFIV